MSIDNTTTERPETDEETKGAEDTTQEGAAEGGEGSGEEEGDED